MGGQEGDYLPMLFCYGMCAATTTTTTAYLGCPHGRNAIAINVSYLGRFSVSPPPPVSAGFFVLFSGHVVRSRGVGGRRRVGACSAVHTLLMHAMQARGGSEYVQDAKEEPDGRQAAHARRPGDESNTRRDRNEQKMNVGNSKRVNSPRRLTLRRGGTVFPWVREGHQATRRPGSCGGQGDYPRFFLFYLYRLSHTCRWGARGVAVMTEFTCLFFPVWSVCQHSL
ncbi:hypothetical protein LX32DRAFT_5028 [Colletotrichum zoysiae]|uniref:Uncharacterized protein n=1 Tax=Colletotrichum zoysiae TaxID=1216348 RepID=A0AAD9M8R1_9PEZI|nr:hypothetical protein LX32DRAFT_5028 [Colletotrichum zoysiae]